MGKQVTLFVSMIVLFSCGLIEASGSEIPKLAFERIDEYVAREMESEGMVGGVMAVTSRGRLLRRSAFGYADLETGAKTDVDTLFQIGSITKSFTAIALLQMVDEGRLRLDAPVSEYLPWFSLRSDYGRIEVHHLMTHTAGIPSNRDDLPSSPYMALALREQATAWPPGERFHYSNVGYQVLHVLLEAVSGKSWADVVEERILQPLGMTETEPSITHSNRERQAIGYLPPFPNRPHHVSRSLVRAPYFEYSTGDGCIVSTAKDMAAYLRMLLQRGNGPSARLLSESSFEAFATPWIQPWGATGYGYGIAVRDKHGLSLLHGGGTVGASAMIVADLEADLGVAVMITGPGNPQALAEFAIETLKNARSGEELPELGPSSSAKQVENAVDYAGTYRSPDGSTLALVATEERLSVLDDGRAVELESRGGDTFYTPEQGLDRYYFRFERDEEDRVVEITHGPRWFTRAAPAELIDPPFPSGWLAYTGRYHANSPFFPGFEIFVRHGRLWAVTYGGGESRAGDEIVLLPLGGGLFQPGEDLSPERLLFGERVGEKTWKASWSGHAFYRAEMH